MKNLIPALTIFIFSLTIVPSAIMAQEKMQIGSHQDEIKLRNVNRIIPHVSQLGISLRENAVNINYKLNFGKGIIGRSALRLPNISFRQINNRESFVLRNLGVALGFEKNIINSKFIDLYGGGDLSTNLDTTIGIFDASFSVHAIVGIAANIGNNMYAFGEIQSGIQLRGKNNFRDKFLFSSRAFNIGIMCKLYS